MRPSVSKNMPKAKHRPSVMVLNGPNLTPRGNREPCIYGKETLAYINMRLAAKAKAAGVPIAFFQTNHEGDIVDRVQAARDEGVGFIVLNPAAFTYSSIALRDALTAVKI